MLRINQQRSAAGAKSYFEEGLSREDYYTQDAIIGRWGGQGSERLGLRGEVTQEAFVRMCDNRHPFSNETLTQRTNDNRTVGYDFNFHAPKSLSLLYALTRDRRLLEAFQESVREAMNEIEADVRTRVRQAGQNDERTTGNFSFAEFVHLTSRPVGGVPDPHLHAHCFVFNATHDDVEGKWKAAQFREIVRNAPFFEAVFHSRLSKKVVDLGLAVERTRAGWEVAGLKKNLLEKFSRRSAIIEEVAREQGITSAKAKSALGAKTREKKAGGQSLDQLRAEWKSRLGDHERREIQDVLHGRGRAAEQPATPGQAVDYALDHGFERLSVMPERRILAAALKRGYGAVNVEQVKGEFAARRDVIRREWAEETYVTTRGVLAEEAATLDFARNGRGNCAPLAARVRPLSGQQLTQEQEQAVRHVLTSNDRVMLIRGAAGTGKTTLLKAAARAVQEAGSEVHVFAPSTEAARGILRRDGFERAETVAMLLVDERMQERVKGGVIWVDEAGLLGSRDLRAIFAVAERQQARVVLMGDERQHGSVPRGDIFRLLQSHAGLQAADVTKIQRQRGAYKQAVEALSRGEIEAGCQQLDRLGAIREVADDTRHALLAGDYLAALKDGKSALVVAPTHREGRVVTALIREQLKAEGNLGEKDHVYSQLLSYGLTEAMRTDPVNYSAGDVVRFHQNCRGGFRKGETCVVSGRDAEGNILAVKGAGETVALPLSQARHFDLYERRELPIAEGDRIRITQNGMAVGGKSRLINGSLHTVAKTTSRGDLVLEGGTVVPREFGGVAHGYCTTSHAAQGKTVDRVFIALGPESFAAASREQFYVSVSRGREAVTVYCENKREMFEAVKHSGGRVSATELVTSEQQTSPNRARLLRHGEHIRREMRQPRPIEPERQPDRNRETGKVRERQRGVER